MATKKEHSERYYDILANDIYNIKVKLKKFKNFIKLKKNW